MGRYMYYLSSTLVKKKGIWIAIVIGMIAVFLMTYFQIKDANGSYGKPVSKINKWSTFDFFLPFIFGSLISTFFIIHAFKSGEQDGTELLVVAKPLTRSQIIFGKFFVTIIAQILYQILLLPLYGILSLIDNLATSSQRIEYVLSFSIGGLIIQFFMIGLITIFASAIGRIGTIVISILFTSIIPIASFIVSGITRSFLPSKNSINLNQYYLVNSIDENDQNKIKKVELIYGDDEKRNFNKIDSKYKKVAYFDPWYQWSRFFTLFVDKSKDTKDFLGGGVLKYYKATKPEFTKDDFKFKMELKDEENKSHYFVPFNRTYDYEYDEDKNLDPNEKVVNVLNNTSDWQISDIVDEFYNDLTSTNNNNNKMNSSITLDNREINQNNFKDLSAFKRTRVISNFLYDYQKNISIKYKDSGMSVINEIRILNKLYEKDPSLQFWNKSSYSKSEDEDYNTNITSLEDLNNSIRPIIHEYIGTSVVIIIWTTITIILIGLSIFLYFRRDFK